MEQCWRWFGPGDSVTLDYIKQAGVTGIVSALHGYKGGVAWSRDDVFKRKHEIEAAGLRWSVCESIPMPTELKLRTGSYRELLSGWKDTLSHLAAAGVGVVNYNFMPVVDWTRTNLHFALASGGYALRFDMIDFVAYDVFVLGRKNAAADYQTDLVASAERRFQGMDDDAKRLLEKNIIAGLPGGEDTYNRDGVAREIAQFDGVSADDLRANLAEFIKEMAPVAEELGIRLGIHADDPPFSLFGLPRIVSTADDFRFLLNAHESLSNGVTFCVGSMGARPDNDLPSLVEEFAPRIAFAHLRNTTREADGSFYEAEHLDGDSDMVRIVFALMDEEKSRREEGRADALIPMRPDHGHLLADDIAKVEAGVKVNAGYSYIGRLKGLAELRGVMRAHTVMAGQ
ncbi:mannonate dehydratase [Rhizobium sp. R693]|uniref:mannonate dehydratase n=1 Tax=Rhizobium sp. R693 TaxID=1764276 RepID=UPI000B534648|nr:mannonate dehydratase [Rhizobium sp. R693]OWV86830.1 mannonate dehydratase [Rhizobium sp. R693]